MYFKVSLLLIRAVKNPTGERWLFKCPKSGIYQLENLQPKFGVSFIECKYVSDGVITYYSHLVNSLLKIIA